MQFRDYLFGQPTGYGNIRGKRADSFGDLSTMSFFPENHGIKKHKKFVKDGGTFKNGIQ